MADLENRPKHLVLLFSFVRGILCILHLVAVFEQGILDLGEAHWRRLVSAGSSADRRHDG